MRRRQRYPVESYHRLYDPAIGPLWSATEGLSPDEDGDHYSPVRDFFEWWYFDAAFDNGYRLVAILHSSLYNAVDHKPTVDVRVTPPGGASVAAIGRYTRADYRAAAERCDVKIAGCHAVAVDSNHYVLSLRQGDVAAELVYESRLPGWRPGTGYLMADDATGHFFRWVAPLPRAEVSGTLTVGGEKLAVQGVGYHDHNWGNFVLADAFSGWYWGRFFAGDGDEGLTVVFGDVVSRGPDPVHVTPLLLIADGQIVTGQPAVSLRWQDPVVEPNTGARYPARLDLSAAIADYQTTMSLRAGRVVEALDFASPPFRCRWPRQAAEMAFYLSLDKPLLDPLARRLLGRASYLRLQAQADLYVRALQTSQFNGEGIYEVMLFHR
jgi:predicted secreted hydrolase